MMRRSSRLQFRTPPHLRSRCLVLLGHVWIVTHLRLKGPLPLPVRGRDSFRTHLHVDSLPSGAGQTFQHHYDLSCVIISTCDFKRCLTFFTAFHLGGVMWSVTACPYYRMMSYVLLLKSLACTILLSMRCLLKALDLICISAYASMDSYYLACVLFYGPRA